jgi:hypothetical protein
MLVPIDASECSRAVRYLIDKRAEDSAIAVCLINVQVHLTSHITQFISHSDIARYHREESAKSLQATTALLNANGIQYRALR